jgi:hypothetical protein
MNAEVQTIGALITQAIWVERGCGLCGRLRGGQAPMVETGGPLGRVHRRCFTAWDRRSEAAEMLGWLPPQDLDLEPARPATTRRAA